VLGRLLKLQDSGGASAPRTVADKPEQQVDLAGLHLLFPSTPAVRSNITCKEEKKHKQSLDSSPFLNLLSSGFSPSLGYLFSSQLEMGLLLWVPLEEEGLLLASVLLGLSGGDGNGCWLYGCCCVLAAAGGSFGVD
jgi:hypothetical protein